jgi:hypothetical protein
MSSTPVATHEPPFALDGTVTAAKLHELLAVQAELTWLDYKSECDINDLEGRIELAKDVGALMIQGGYLVIGADNSGSPLGLSPRQAKLLDQATLSDKLARYLPDGFEVRSAVHDLGDGAEHKQVVVIWVSPHPDGWCIFSQDGQYSVGGKTKLAFSRGDVYARHGSRSEPWAQADIAQARARLIAQEKESWRAEIADELLRIQRAATAQLAVVGPADAFTWQIDAAGFEAAAVEFIRRDDDVPVRRMLRGAQADALALLDAGKTADLVTLLDRLTTLAALGLELRRPTFFSMAVEPLLALYESGVTLWDRQAAARPPVQQLWLRIAERLYGLGALAVRLQEWPTVRALAVASVPSLEERAGGRTWHRHALTESSNARLLNEPRPEGGERTLSLLLFARAVAVSNPALRPDLPGDVESELSGSDPLLASLCKFDLLVTVVSGVRVDAGTQSELLSVSYPNFGQFDDRRVGTLPRVLTSHTRERATLLPEAPDEQVATVLDLASHAAQRAGAKFFGWEDFHDQSVMRFIEYNTRLQT